MLRVSLRNLQMHTLRLLLTIAAVTIGVAFISGTFVLSDTMSKAFDELYTGLSGDTDVVVRSQAAFTDYSVQSEARPLPEDLVATISDVPGVQVAEGSVTGFALILDKDGAPIQPGGAPTLASSVGGDARLAGEFTYQQGRAPSDPDEVTIDARSAEGAGFVIGDTVQIVLHDGNHAFSLSGITGFGETDSLAGATLAGFDLRTSQDLLGKSGQVDQISVLAAPDVDVTELRSDIEAVIPTGVEALSGAEVADESAAAMQEGLAFFSQVLLVLAAVSLLVGSFVIWNTFNVLVAQRRREVGLLRAVGATRRQVLAGIMAESAVVGVISAGLGLLAGLGLAAGLRELVLLIGIEVPSTATAIEPRTVAAALLVGVGVTLVAAAAPAWAATRVAPIEALRVAQPTTDDVSTRRRTTGWVLLGAGLCGLSVCAAVGDLMALTGLAGLLAFVGLVVAGPSLAQAAARLADHGRPGSGWRLAARNIARVPRRAAATALALSIGVTVVAAIAVTATSMQESVAQTVTGANRSDFILQPGGAGSGISPSVAGLLREVDDLDTVVELRYSGARVEGEDASVVGLDAAGLEEVVDLALPEGSLDLGPGRMLIGAAEAERLGVGVGDDLTITFPEGGQTVLTVAATLGAGPTSLIGSPYLVSAEDFSANVTSRMDSSILVTAAPGADLAATETLLEQSLADYPNVRISDPDELTAATQASMDQVFGLVTALLLLAVVVAVLGIVNTLVLSVLERTRELGLMRAVGATRRQIRGVVRRESVIMAVLGALSGSVLGTLSGVALSRAMGSQGITVVSVPTTQLLVYLVVAAAVGVLAAIGPARRASNVDMMRAVVQQ